MTLMDYHGWLAWMLLTFMDCDGGGAGVQDWHGLAWIGIDRVRAATS